MSDQKNYEAKLNSKETPKPTMMDELTAFKKKYEDLAKDAKIKETQGAKRSPLPDGTLELTDEEKHEFSNKFLKHTNFIYFFMVIGDKIHMRFINGIYDNVCDNYKAILLLAERFNLEV